MEDGDDLWSLSLVSTNWRGPEVEEEEMVHTWGGGGGGGEPLLSHLISGLIVL
jgi:hypothetical protein